jgi:signal transduction histidine kinase
MPTDTLPTQFAPAERAAQETLEKQANYFEDLNLLDPLLNAVPDSVVVLNPERQIVYANSIFLNALGEKNIMPLLGKRPGEALLCEHAAETPGGCGTTENCRQCGAVLAIMEAQKGQKSTQECRISVNNNGEAASLDLRVTATPFTFDNDNYTVFAATDISNEKRRSILERIFFHDITNTAGAIFGLVELLADTEDLNELSDFGFNEMLSQASTQLMDEIQAQRQLMAAERGELEVDAKPIQSRKLLDKLVAMYRNHQVGEDRNLMVSPETMELIVESDEALLGRVVGNMIKNALEASAPGETVTVGCEEIYGFARFWIHNPRYIPKKIQLQIFQRSFSTKGKGRGLGTYSMKLLSENYLQGRVSFETDPEKGTTFMGMYPVKWPKPLPAAE